MYPLGSGQTNLLASALTLSSARLETWVDPVTPCPPPTRYLIEFDSIKYKGTRFELRSPLVVSLHKEVEDQSWVCESEELGIAAIGETGEKAVHSLSEDFSVLWDEIAKCPDEQLTDDAQELKQKLNALVKSITR